MQDTEDLDKPIWGTRAIGKEINRSPRQTQYLIDVGAIPATKVGGIWTTTRRRLRSRFAEAAA